MSMAIKCPACHDVKLVGQSGAGLHLCKACCGPDADQFAFEILTHTIRALQRADEANICYGMWRNTWQWLRHRQSQEDT